MKNTPVRLPSVCAGCKRSGLYTLGSGGRPRWCRCKGIPGVLHPPPGHVTVFHYRSKEEAAFRERCRLAGNAERQARDGLSDRFVRCGRRGWRELPRSSPKRRGLDLAYRRARRTLDALQAACAHDILDRSRDAPEYCGACYAHVFTDIVVHRQFARRAS